MQREDPLLGHREGPEVVEQPGHERGLIEHRPEALGIGAVQAVEHALEGAADHLQRRAQLVGHVGKQFSPPAFVRLQPLGHLVEGRAQSSELSGGRQVDPGS